MSTWPLVLPPAGMQVAVILPLIYWLDPITHMLQAVHHPEVGRPQGTSSKLHDTRVHPVIISSLVARVQPAQIQVIMDRSMNVVVVLY